MSCISCKNLMHMNSLCQALYHLSFCTEFLCLSFCSIMGCNYFSNDYLTYFKLCVTNLLRNEFGITAGSISGLGSDMRLILPVHMSTQDREIIAQRSLSLVLYTLKTFCPFQSHNEVLFQREKC